MKYFTPDRYSRLATLNDKRAFLAAHEEWERAIADYQAHRQRIRHLLPGALRRLVESVALHDARVVDMYQARRVLTFVLQPESLPSCRIVLAYSLVEPPVIRKDVIPQELRSEPVEWLYDEISVARASRNGAQRSFFHDVLLSNGWELHLHFRSVRVTRRQPLLTTVSS
jgi:hypothetical protein